jgi:hypothetical protein
MRALPSTLTKLGGKKKLMDKMASTNPKAHRLRCLLPLSAAD